MYSFYLINIAIKDQSQFYAIQILTYRYHTGTEVVVRSIRSIKKGEIIAENYGPIFTQVEYKERQYTLKCQYWFDCKCEACLGDWPTLDNMNNNIMRFRCDCSNIVTVPVDTNEFMIPCNNCNQHINIFKGLKVLQVST